VPTESFARRLRMELLSKENRVRPVAELVNVHAIGPGAVRSLSPFARPMNALAFAVAGILVIMGVYTITRELSPLFLPGLNQRAMSAEAAAIEREIDIQLSHIDYFQQTSTESSVALKQVTEKNLDHLNEALIKNEAASFEEPATPESIDAQLDEMLKAVIE